MARTFDTLSGHFRMNTRGRAMEGEAGGSHDGWNHNTTAQIRLDSGDGPVVTFGAEGGMW